MILGNVANNPTPAARKERTPSAPPPAGSLQDALREVLSLEAEAVLINTRQDAARASRRHEEYGQLASRHCDLPGLINQARIRLTELEASEISQMLPALAAEIAELEAGIDGLTGQIRELEAQRTLLAKKRSDLTTRKNQRSHKIEGAEQLRESYFAELMRVGVDRTTTDARWDSTNRTIWHAEPRNSEDAISLLEMQITAMKKSISVGLSSPQLAGTDWGRELSHVAEGLSKLRDDAVAVMKRARGLGTQLISIVPEDLSKRNDFDLGPAAARLEAENKNPPPVDLEAEERQLYSRFAQLIERLGMVR
jgi:chromosome segregation ATPase